MVRKAVKRHPLNFFAKPILPSYLLLSLLISLYNTLYPSIEPLLTFTAYDPLLKAIHMPDPQVKVKVMKTIISNLPAPNREILNEILQLAVHISHREETNRMSPHNIAVVLGPTVLRAEKESLESMMRDSMQVVKVVEDMIENYAVLFGNATIEIQRPVSLNPQEAEFLRKRAASLFPSSVDKTVDEWRAEVGKLKEQMRELEDRLAEDTREREVLHAYQANLEAKYSAEKDEKDHLQAELDAANESAKEAVKAVELAQSQAKSDHERAIQSLESQLTEQTAQVASLESSSKDAKQQLSTLKSTYSTLESKSKAAEASIVEANTKLNAAQSKLDTLEKSKAKSDAALVEAEKRANKAEKALIDANAASKTEIDTLKQKNSDLVAENANLTAKMKSALTAAAAADGSSAAAAASSAAVVASNAALEELRSTTRTKVKDLETDLGAVQQTLKTAQDKILRLEKENTKLETDARKAVDLAAKNEADMKKAIEEKRTAEAETKKAQLTTRTAQSEVDTLRKELSETLETSAKSEADERLRSGVSVKKAREERSNAELAMKKTQLENANLEATIKTLTTKNNALTEEIATLKTAQKSHNSNIKKLQIDRDNMESECKKLQIQKEAEIKRRTTDVAAAETAIQKVNAEKSSLENERQKLLSERNRMNVEIDGLRASLETLKGENKRLSTPPTKAPEQEAQKLRNENESLQAKLKAVKEELDKTSACVEGLERQITELKKKGTSTPSTASPVTPSKSTASSSTPISTSGRVFTPAAKTNSTPTLSDKEKELAEQLFSWMTLSLKLESVLQDRQTANYDSGALLHRLFTDKTPWNQWPGIIQDNMTLK